MKNIVIVGMDAESRWIGHLGYDAVSDNVDVKRIVDECRTVSADIFKRLRQESIYRMFYCQEVNRATVNFLIIFSK